MLTAYIIHILISLYVFMLAMRMFVKNRDAYFNPFYNLIYKATEPVMAPVHKTMWKGPRDLDSADFTVFLPMIFMVTMDGLVAGITIPDLGLLAGLAVRFLNFSDYVFLTFVVLIMVFSVFYRYSRYPMNPFLRAGFKIMEPFYVAIGRLGGFFREHSGPVLFIIALILHLLVTSLLYPFFEKDMLTIYAERPGMLAANIAAHSIITLLLLCVFFTYVIIIGALMSWFSPDPRNPITQLIQLLSEPINRPFRRIIPHLGGMDISPIFSILALQLAQRLGYQLTGYLLFYSKVR